MTRLNPTLVRVQSLQLLSALGPQLILEFLNGENASLTVDDPREALVHNLGFYSVEARLLCIDHTRISLVVVMTGPIGGIAVNSRVERTRRLIDPILAGIVQFGTTVTTRSLEDDDLFLIVLID